MTNQTALDNQTFDIVHIIGIVSCTISVIASCSILVYLFNYEPRPNTKRSFTVGQLKSLCHDKANIEYKLLDIKK